MENIYKELAGKTEMNQELELDLSRRIAEIEEKGSIVPPLTKGDFALGLISVAALGILPVILTGMGLI